MKILYSRKQNNMTQIVVLDIAKMQVKNLDKIFHNLSVQNSIIYKLVY